MEQFELTASLRSHSGTRRARNLRKEGQVPAVVYSRGEGAQSIVISNRDFTQLAERALPSQVFTLKSEDSEIKDTEVLVKDVQLDGKSGKVLHVDFQRLHAGEEVIVRIPLVYEGEAPGVKNQGGVLTKFARDILVSCIPKNIPQFITISVSSLELGERIRGADIDLPEGVSLAGKDDETIVNVVAGREARLGAADVLAAEGEEGAEAAEGEGDEAKDES